MRDTDSATPTPPQIQNHLGQPVGAALADWVPPPRPEREPMLGRFCRLEPLDADRHAAGLYEANALDAEGRMWTYLPYGPFGSIKEYAEWLRAASESNDPRYFAIVSLRLGRPVGVASFLRIAPSSGSIEVGHLAFSPLLQRTAAATEAMFLMMQRVFELGYRRYEWKCDSLNAASRAAALRLGFTFEGVFRQATVYKGRNRDTAWYSIVDREWPRLKAAFRSWLAPENFDAQDRQRARLAQLAASLEED